MEHTEQTEPIEQAGNQAIANDNQAQIQASSQKPSKKHKWLDGKRRKLYAAVFLVGVLLIASAAWFFVAGHPGYNENKGINKSEYQAVFLTNGQVYFGKLTDLNHKYVSLTDIYYLQVQQGGKGSLQDASGSSSSDSQVSLAKLGSELHGPEDKMSISSDQVLFWENMKSDSKVVQAITKYQNQ